MNFLWYLLSGLAGGLLGGMGMGGGTLLIPILTIFLSVGQHTAQAVNIVAFIPMAIVALIIHIKNKLVEFKDILFVIIPALLLAVLGSVLTAELDGELLKKIFGVFLIVLSVVQFFSDEISEKIGGKE